MTPALALLLGAACSGCGSTFDGTFPEPSEPELVVATWEDEPVDAVEPSIAYEDDLWHIWFTGFEGSYVVILHATSEDGVDFVVSSAHTVIEAPEDPHTSGFRGAAAWDGGSSYHLLANAWGDGWTGLVHGTSSDGTDFEYEPADAFLVVDDSQADATSWTAAGARYEPITADAWLEGQVGGDPETRGCGHIESDDGGATWSDPEWMFDPSDLPGDGWTSSTAGPGGIWGCTVVPDPGGYGWHALYAGAPPTDENAVAWGHAWSEDLLDWNLTTRPWRAEDEGRETRGLTLVEDAASDGWWLYWGETEEGTDPPAGGEVWRMWLPWPDEV